MEVPGSIPGTADTAANETGAVPSTARGAVLNKYFIVNWVHVPEKTRDEPVIREGRACSRWGSGKG